MIQSNEEELKFLDLQENNYDVFISLPQIQTFNQNTEQQYTDFKTFQDLVFTCFLKKDIFMNQQNSGKDPEKMKEKLEKATLKNDGKFPISKETIHPDVDPATMVNTHQLLKLGTHEDFFNQETKSKSVDYLKQHFQGLYIKFVIEILRFSCGCDVRCIYQGKKFKLGLKTDGEDDYDELELPDPSDAGVAKDNDNNNLGVKYLIKIRLNQESLLQQIAANETRLSLKFQPTYIEQVKNQQQGDESKHEVGEPENMMDLDRETSTSGGNINASSMQDLQCDSYQEKMRLIREDTEKLNKLMNQPMDQEQNFPQNGFLQKQPWPTNMEVDIRINPKMASTIFLNYPFNIDDSIITIKKIAYPELLEEKGIIDESRVGHNPFMTNLQQFNFGTPKDAPDLVRIVPQDIRIDSCVDNCRDWLNFEFFQVNGMIKDFDGLHYFKDTKVLTDTICRQDSFALLTKTLSDKDLVIIKHYWGCEVASQQLFLNQLTKLLTNPTIFAIIVQIIIYGIEMAGQFYTIILRILFSGTLIIFSTIFLQKFSERERLYSPIWGGAEDMISDSKMTKITTFQGPQYFDIFLNQFEPLQNRQNYWRQISWCTMIFLFFIMGWLVMLFLQLKQQAQLRSDDTWVLIWGLFVSGIIKVFQAAWIPLSTFFAEKENYRQVKNKNNSLSLKNFIFNYFNLFYNFFYLVFLKKYVIGEPCLEVKVKSWFSHKEVQYESCNRELQSQLIINILFFLAFNVVEIGTPMAMQQQNNMGMNDEDSHVPEYSSLYDLGKDQMENLMEDQLEVIIQLTMVLTFGLSFPLSVAMFWATNFLEIRIDLVKQAKQSKRGECRAEMGIGIWFNIIEIVGVMAVATNIMMVLCEVQQFNQGQSRIQGEQAFSFTFDESALFTFFIVVQQLFLTVKQMAEFLVTGTNRETDKMFELNQIVRDEVKMRYFENGQDDDTSNDLLTKEMLKLKHGNVIYTDKEFEHETINNTDQNDKNEVV